MHTINATTSISAQAQKHIPVSPLPHFAVTRYYSTSYNYFLSASLGSARAPLFTRFPPPLTIPVSRKGRQ